MMEACVIETGDLLLAGAADETLLSLKEAERRHILRALEICGGRRAETARRLGIGRNTLTRKLQKY